MQTRWSLFNKEDKLRVDDLTPEQVKTILLAVPSHRMKDWFACRGGDVHWHALTDIPEFYEDVRALRGLSESDNSVPPSEASKPPVPQRDRRAPQAPPSPAPQTQSHRPLFEDVSMEADPTLAIESEPTEERRSARRFLSRLDFKVIQGGKVFESQTKNVSMSGLALKEQLPGWIPKTFRAQVGLHGQVLNIVAARVEKTDGSQLKILEAESWELLRRWIANW